MTRLVVVILLFILQLVSLVLLFVTDAIGFLGLILVLLLIINLITWNSVKQPTRLCKTTPCEVCDQEECPIFILAQSIKEQNNE